MPNTVNTGYSHYPRVPDKVINEYATPIVLAYNGLHHYTATEWTSEPSDGPYIKLARFLAEIDTALYDSLNLITQLQNHEFRHQLASVVKEVAKLKDIFHQREVNKHRLMSI